MKNVAIMSAHHFMTCTFIAVYEECVSNLIAVAHEYLDNVLDWDNDADMDLNELAKIEGDDWKTKLPSMLDITDSVMKHIQKQRKGKDSFL